MLNRERVKGMGKPKVWKRKLALLLAGVLLAGNISDGFTIAGLGKSIDAYAYASSSEARKEEAEYLPQKGERADYYIEEGNAAELLLSEGDIMDALDRETEETLNLHLLGYTNAQAVLPLYEAIEEETEGYRLLLQGTFGDDNELAYFLFAKEGKKKDNPLADMKIMLINSGHAGEETQEYNVMIPFEGENYRLEEEDVRLFTFKELTEEQIEEKGLTAEEVVTVGEAVKEESGDSGEAVGEETVETEETAGDENMESSESTEGAETEADERTEGTETETDERTEGTETETDERTEGAGTESDERTEGVEAEADKNTAGAETEADESIEGAETEADENTEGAETEADEGTEGEETEADENTEGAETEADEGTEGEETEADEDTEGAETEADENTEGVETETDENTEGAEAETEESAKGAEEEADKSTVEADAETETKDTEKEDGIGTEDADAKADEGDGQDGQKLAASRNKVHRVFAAYLASDSQAALDEQIKSLREELKRTGKEAYVLSHAGSFQMDRLEMKMINQEEITEEDIQEAEAEEQPVFRRFMNRISKAFIGENQEEEKTTGQQDGFVGLDTEELPYIGIRANTLAVVRLSAAPREVFSDEVEIDWSALPIMDGDQIYYGMSYNLDEFLPQNGKVEGSDGNSYDVSISNITGRSEDEGSSGWLWDHGETITVDERNIKEYQITFAAKDGEGNTVEEHTITLPVCVIDFQLPQFQYFMRENTYDLYDSQGSGVKAVDQEGKEYSVRLHSVERRLVNDQEDDWDWEAAGKPSQITVDQSNISAYVLTYEAYTADPQNSEKEIIVGISDPLEVAVYQSSGIGDSLDQAGDVAYVTASYMEDSLRTGTAPWDEVDGEPRPGEDTTAEDNRLRTFDTASFNVRIQSTVRPGSPYTHYRNGTLCYEIILPGSEKQVMFDEGGMSWLKAKPNSNYQIRTVKADGKEMQVLQGSFLWEPSDGNPTAIGESYLELNVAYRVLNMKNGDTITPRATFWLGVNQISEDSSAGLIFGEGDTADRYQFPKELVTDNQTDCEIHDTREADTVEAEPVTITAAPRYNLRLVFDGPVQTSVGKFDFSTGNEYAPNKKDFVVENGRIGVLGVTVQIHGKTGFGLRGVEFPDEDKPITFDLTLKSVFGSSGELPGNYDITNTEYMPLVWSVDGNSSSRSQRDGRAIPTNITGGSKNSANNTGGNNYSCYKGGTWSAVQEGNVVHVTVEGFEISQNLAQIPNSSMGSGNPNAATYFDRSVIKNYWDLTRLSFSAGEIWIVQPFTRTADGKTISILQDEDILGEGNSCTAGNFSVTAQDGKLYAESVSGQICAVPEGGNSSTDNSNQMAVSDDMVSQNYDYRLPGTYDTMIYYNKYAGAYYEPLTEGCYNNGQDWAAIGGKMDLQIRVDHDGKDPEYGGVAYDAMVKFDDAMFQPQLETINGVKPASGATRALYGVLNGHETTGWPNKDKDPKDPDYDAVIKNATAEDMTFYSLSEFKKLQEEQGYVCVAVVGEWRGDYSSQMTHNHFYVRGSVKLDDELAGNVFIISPASYCWRRADVEDEAREYLGKPSGELTSADWSKYAREGFPSLERRSDGYADYPEFGIRDDCEGGGDAGRIKGYQKARYNEDGSLAYDGDTNIHWGDSCYIVGYKAQIQKDTAQTTITNGETVTKKYYDLDGGQRTADYVLHPAIIRAGGVKEETGTTQKFTIDKIEIRDQIPEDLYYIDGFGYLGGEYQQKAEGVQGTVEGGTDIFERMQMGDGDKAPITFKEGEEEITIQDISVSTETDADGKVSEVVWTLTGVEVYANKNTTLPPLYYSCTIGKAGREDDVENNQQLKNTVTIGGTNLSTKYTVSDGNKAELSIFVNKLQATSLSKIADSAAVEVGDPMGFQLRVGNNSENAMNIVAFDKMPYNGDDQGTQIGDTNKIRLTEIRFDTDDPEVIKKILGEDPDEPKIAFYYTVNEKYRNKSSADYMNADKTVNAENLDAIRESEDWEKLEVTYDPEDPLNVQIHLPEGEFCPVAIAAVGLLDGGVTIPLHTTLELTDPQPGDYIGTTLSNRDMQSTARSFVVNRTIEGLAWKDANNNGLRESSEEVFDGLRVTLKRTGPAKDGGDNSGAGFPEGGITILTGQSYDYLTGKTANIASGNYRFTNVPEGTYTVIFENGDGEEKQLQYYAATAVNQGSNDAIDSDAEGIYAEDDPNRLLRAEITGIKMNQLSDIQTMNFISRNNDAGFVVPKGSLKLEKRSISSDGQLLSGAVFTLEGTGKMSSGGTDPLFESSAKEFLAFISAYEEQAGIEVKEGVIKNGILKLTFTVVNGSADFGLAGFGFKKLPRGSYTLEEIQTPAGYKFVAGEEREFIIDNENLTEDITGKVAFVNEPQSFTLKKVSQATKKPLSDVTFTIQCKDGQDGTEIKVTTGEDGTAEFTLPSLAIGTAYQVEEVKSPEGYTAIPAFTLTVADAGFTESGEHRVKLAVGADASDQVSVSEDGVTLTVNNAVETVMVKGKKTWKDNNNQDGVRPQAVRVILQRRHLGSEDEGSWKTVEGKTALITSTKTSYVFENLPKYDESVSPLVEYEYRVAEAAEDLVTDLGSYTPSGGENVDGAYDLENSYTPQVTEVQGEKIWKDGDDQDQIRPDFIEIHLYGTYEIQDKLYYLEKTEDGFSSAEYQDQDQKPILETQQVSAGVDGSWTWQFTGLPRYWNGQWVDYYVKESPVEGYAAEVKGENLVNTHYAAAEVNLAGMKSLVGRDFAEGEEFSFTAYDEEGNPVSRGKTVLAEGSQAKILFEPISYTQEDMLVSTTAGTAIADRKIFTYILKEDVPEDAEGGMKKGITYDQEERKVKVEVTADPETGRLHARQMENPEEITFTNWYEATASNAIRGKKRVDHFGEITEPGEERFTFGLYDEQGRQIAKVVSDAEGNFQFPEQQYCLSQMGDGVYTYTVREMETESWFIPDANEFTVIVTLTDNGDGTLQVETDCQDAGGNGVEEPVFVNTYIATGSNAVRMSKELTGRKLEASQFTFGLYVDGDDGLEMIAQTSNDQSGDIRFTAEEYQISDNTFVFNQPGEYTFYVKEILPETMPGYTFDDSLYQLVFTVADSGKGVLDTSLSCRKYSSAGTALEEGEEVEKVVFHNRYDLEELKISLDAEKRLTGRELEAGQFVFQLYEEDELLAEAANDAEGQIAFSLSFHSPGTYHYTIIERNDRKPGYQYDSVPVEVTVQVEDNGDGTMRAEMTCQKGENTVAQAVFANQYTTGTARFAPQVRKVLEGRRFISSDVFTFGLRRPDGTEEIVELRPQKGSQTAMVAFAGETYGQEDIGKTFTYEIYEKKGAISSLTYSEAVYSVSVTVKDAGNGELYTEVMCGDEPFGGIAEFVNTYRSPSSGGGNNNGGGGGTRRNPGGDSPATTTIMTGDTPLAPYPGEGSQIFIPDEEVPLFGIPKTGDSSISLEVIAGAWLVSLMGILSIIRKRKKERK